MARTQSKTVPPAMSQKAPFELANGRETFIPYIPPIIVGMVKTSVNEVRIFMTLFKLFETIAEKVSVIWLTKRR